MNIVQSYLEPSQHGRTRPVAMLAAALACSTMMLGASVTVSAQQSPPTFSKAFSPDIIGPGSVSTLTFTIFNGGASPVTALAFTDTLPTGVTIANPAVASTTCLDGQVGAPAGGGTISFSDGRLGVGLTCTATVDVTSSSVGTHTNISGDLTSSAGTTDPASDTLTVDTTLPGFSKSFAPSSIALGGRSTLTFTIDNSANTSLRFYRQFSDRASDC